MSTEEAIERALGELDEWVDSDYTVQRDAARRILRELVAVERARALAEAREQVRELRDALTEEGARYGLALASDAIRQLYVHDTEEQRRVG